MSMNSAQYQIYISQLQSILYLVVHKEKNTIMILDMLTVTAHGGFKINILEQIFIFSIQNCGVQSKPLPDISPPG